MASLTGGSIRFNDRDTAGLAPHELVRAGLFHVMEGRRVFEDLTVEENLVAATYALNGRGNAKPNFDLVYEYFPRLFERRRGLAGYLSGGEQQMLAIGRALIARPTLILLDEPSLGLAPLLVENIFSIIARINAEQGVSMLLVEQNASVALAVAHTGYIMESGKVVIDGPAEKLAADKDVREFYLGMGHGGEMKSFQRYQALQAAQAVAVMTIQLENYTLPQMLRQRAQQQPNRVAIRQKDFGIWNPITWDDYFPSRQSFRPRPVCHRRPAGRAYRHHFGKPCRMGAGADGRRLGWGR